VKGRKKQFLKFTLFLCLFTILIFGAQIAHAATLYFSPSSGNFTEGNIFTVNLMTNTQGEAINNTEAVINFPSDLLELTSVSKFGSIFSLWVLEPNFSNAAGRISFNGGAPTPGYNGSNGKIITMVFKAKKAGQASLVSTSAAVRANDGYGTDVLKNNPQASFILIAEGTPAPPATEKPVPGTPQEPRISSETHPNSEEWYAKSDAIFTWPLSADITAVRLSVNETPISIPTIIHSPPIKTRTIDNLDDGIWYFHAQLENINGWGETADFKFQIDTKQPDYFDIQLAPREDLTERKVGFIFDAHDELSGINHYEVRIDDRADEIWTDDGEGVYITSPISPGKHVLIAKAVDKAGNFIADSIEFTVEQDPLFKFGFLAIDVLSVIIPVIALLILLLLLLWFLWYKFKTRRDRLRKEVREAEQALHKAFDLLREETREEIKILKEAGTKRQLTKEEKRIIDQLEKNLDDAEKFIGKEIEDVEKEVE